MTIARRKWQAPESAVYSGMGWKIVIALLLAAVTSSAEDTNRLKTLGKGAFSGIQEAVQVVVTNQTQWAELWQKHTAQKTPKPPPPEVDFSKETILFVASGKKTTGGYSVEISDVRRAEGKTEVVVTSKEPKPGGFNIQALTAPFHIVAVPRIEGEVKFKTTENKKGA
jgi:hypothetical protein